MKFILLNGPAGVGKDTIAAALKTRLSKLGKESTLEKFSKPIKDAIAAAFNMNTEMRQMFFESPEKNNEQEFFFGRTPRQAQIDFSEIYIKPRFSETAFAELLCRRLDEHKPELVIVSDCGFTPEAEYLIRQHGGRNVVAICLTREVDGKQLTFKGDSRNYIDHDHVPDIACQAWFSNDGTPNECADAIINHLQKWLGLDD